jgi:hypothetical protein
VDTFTSALPSGGNAGRHHAAVVIGVYATLALDMFGSVTSSPQTTELFAKDREGTLLKYVYLADGGGLALGLVMSWVDGTPWPFVGAAIICLPMHFLYKHAAKVGKSQDPPKTASQR